jgi:hypothetical protein
LYPFSLTRMPAVAYRRRRKIEREAIAPTERDRRHGRYSPGTETDECATVPATLRNA